MHAFTQSVGVVGEPLFHVVVAPDWSSICQKSSQSSFIVASTRIWVWALSRGGKPNKHLGQIETTPDRQMKCNFEQQRSCSYGVEVGARSGQTGVRFHARLRNYSPHKTAAMPPPPPPGRWRFMVCEKRPRPALIPLPGPINMFDSISIPESRWGLNSWQSTAAIWWPVVGSAHRRGAEEGEFRSDEIARCINIYRQIVLNTHSNHLHHTRTGNPDDPNATCGRNEVPHRCQFKLCKFRCSCFGME